MEDQKNLTCFGMGVSIQDDGGKDTAPVSCGDEEMWSAAVSCTQRRSAQPERNEKETFWSGTS